MELSTALMIHGGMTHGRKQMVVGSKRRVKRRRRNEERDTKMKMLSYI